MHEWIFIVFEICEVLTAISKNDRFNNVCMNQEIRFDLHSRIMFWTMKIFNKFHLKPKSAEIYILIENCQDRWMDGYIDR